MPEYDESITALSNSAVIRIRGLSGNERLKALQEVSAEGLKADIILATPEWTWLAAEVQRVAEDAKRIADEEALRLTEGLEVSHDQLILSKIRASVARERERTALEIIEFVKTASKLGQKAKTELEGLTSG